MSRRKRKIPLNLKNNPILAITPGDLEGIGPEIIIQSISRYIPRLAFLMIAPPGVFPHSLARPVESPDEILEPGYYQQPPPELHPEPSFAMVKCAADLALSGRIAGMVTGPISKEKWLDQGVPFAGHTDFLAQHAGVSDHAMIFWSEDMKVLLYTIHIPLKEVFSHLYCERIIEFIQKADSDLRRLFGRKFHFLFCGINPHNGEAGHLGCEEKEEIMPALNVLKERVSVAGFYPPDVVYLKQRELPDSIVVAWYHDQGLIPFKLLHFRDGVNLTLGLPYIRTSPDHGTAFDIAGKGIADSDSMLAAIRLAELLARRDSINS